MKTLNEIHTENVEQIGIENAEIEEKCNEFLRYIKESIHFVQYLKNMPEKWKPVHGELNSYKGRNQYATLMNRVLSALNGEIYIYDEIHQSMRNVTSFMQMVLLKYPRVRPVFDSEYIEMNELGLVKMAIIDEEGETIEKYLSLEMAFWESVKYFLRIEEPLDEEFVEMYDVDEEDMPFQYGTLMWFNFGVAVDVFECFCENVVSDLVEKNWEQNVDLYDLMNRFKIHFDDSKIQEYNVIFDNKYSFGKKPYLTISAPDFGIEENNYIQNIGWTKDIKFQIVLHNRENLKLKKIHFCYEELTNECILKSCQCCKVSWGKRLSDSSIEFIIEELENLRDLRIKIYIKEAPEIAAYIGG